MFCCLVSLLIDLLLVFVNLEFCSISVAWLRLLLDLSLVHFVCLLFVGMVFCLSFVYLLLVCLLDCLLSR